MLNAEIRPNTMNTWKLKRPLNLAIQNSLVTSSMETIIIAFGTKTHIQFPQGPEHYTKG